MARNKKFKIEVVRRYYVTDEIEVEATTEEKAKELAEKESNNKDYTGQLSLEDVETTIVED